jgi:type IV pilus biogenesis protein CpaD/CtpE
MRIARAGTLVLVALLTGLLAGCASTGGTSAEGRRSDLLTRDEIMGAEVTNLYDVIDRLRPRWLMVRSTRSFNMETVIVVFQNDMHLGTTEALKQMSPELAYEIAYMDGARASATLPGITSGQHVEAAIIVRTRPRT